MRGHLVTRGEHFLEITQSQEGGVVKIMEIALGNQKKKKAGFFCQESVKVDQLLTVPIYLSL